MKSVYNASCRSEIKSLAVLSIVWLFTWSAFAQLTTSPTADVGQFYPFLKEYSDQLPHSLSYLSPDRPDRQQWRAQGRAKMLELLSYAPPASPLKSETLEKTQMDGYTKTLVRYSIAANQTTEAFLLIPDNLTEPAPAIIAIHDHGGFYFFGKEKIAGIENPPKILQEFIDRSYGGRTFADELARRGFVVLVPDGFYFGSQRIDAAQVDERFTRELKDLEYGSDEYIRRFNKFASSHETLTAKTIFTAGATWPGILFHGDRIAVDYLLTLEQVDPERIGCMGLSIGGFRSAHLAGLDSRIKVAVVAGWMTTYESLLKNHLRFHTWMIYVPGQLRYLDLPDVVSLNAPRPLMVINCLQDKLFTLEGMKAAESQLNAIYSEMGAQEHFLCRYYDVPHSLNVSMQNDAIAWLERWLK